MEIRAYVPGDLNQVVELWQRCELLAPQNNPHKDIERKLGTGGELFLVGEESGLIIAFYRALGYSIDPVTSLGKRLIPD